MSERRDYVSVLCRGNVHAPACPGAGCTCWCHDAPEPPSGDLDMRVAAGDVPVLEEALAGLHGVYQWWLNAQLATSTERELAQMKLDAVYRIVAAVGRARGKAGERGVTGGGGASPVTLDARPGTVPAGDHHEGRRQ